MNLPNLYVRVSGALWVTMHVQPLSSALPFPFQEGFCMKSVEQKPAHLLSSCGLANAAPAIEQPCFCC